MKTLRRSWVWLGLALPLVIGADECSKLPGMVDGVEPESHSHHPPMADSRGNLYRITEAPESESNHPKMMKSADGGSTWVEADSAHRPNARDLEGGYQLQFGTSIYSIFTRDSDVWWQEFHTSDAASSPDKWITEEVVDSGLTSSNVDQFASLTRTSDGKFWMFYSDTLVSGRQQIGYRRRTGPNTYSAKVKVDSSAGSWSAPVSVLGAGDVTHLFYQDELNQRLYWRTLSAAGVLSAATRIDTSGTADRPVPHTNAVYYSVSGVENIVIGFVTGSGILKTVTITNRVVGPEQTVSSSAVLENPAPTTNDGGVAHLAKNGSTIYAMWSRKSDGDIFLRSRPHGGAWSAEQRAWASGSDEADYVYNNVYTRGGRRVLGFTYDIGPHPDDAGNIEYNEIALP